jgi:hypothetical protein
MQRGAAGLAWCSGRGGDLVRCGSCGYDNRADSVYCGQCRAALTRPCAACGEPAPVGAEACPACGSSLTATVPPPGGWWRGAPGEPTAVYGPADLAWAGTAGGSRGADGGETRFTGVARDVQQRQHESMMHVDFRIERHDPSGNRLAPVPAEMRGTTHGFSGRVSNGDEIRVVDGRWRNGTLRVRELENLTTGAVVRSSPSTASVLRRLAVFLTIVASIALLFHFAAPLWAIVPLMVIAFLVLVVNPRRLLMGMLGQGR